MSCGYANSLTVLAGQCKIVNSVSVPSIDSEPSTTEVIAQTDHPARLLIDRVRATRVSMRMALPRPDHPFGSVLPRSVGGLSQTVAETKDVRLGRRRGGAPRDSGPACEHLGDARAPPLPT